MSGYKLHTVEKGDIEITALELYDYVAPVNNNTQASDRNGVVRILSKGDTLGDIFPGAFDADGHLTNAYIITGSVLTLDDNTYISFRTYSNTLFIQYAYAGYGRNDFFEIPETNTTNVRDLPLFSILVSDATVEIPGRPSDYQPYHNFGFINSLLSRIYSLFRYTSASDSVAVDNTATIGNLQEGSLVYLTDTASNPGAYNGDNFVLYRSKSAVSSVCNIGTFLQIPRLDNPSYESNPSRVNAYRHLYSLVNQPPTRYTATFTGGSGTTGNPPEPISADINPDEGTADIVMPDQGTLSKAGLFFSGWSLGSRIYQRGDVVSIAQDETFTAFWDTINPNYPGSPTSPAGGGGSLVITTDEVAIPSIPDSVITSTGNLVTIFNPSISELQTLADELWGSNVFNALKNLYTNANEAVVSLATIPFYVDTSDNKHYWKIGGVTVAAPMDRVESQFAEFDFGSVSIPEIWGNCLDYGNNTHIQIVLPYIGARSVDTDAVMKSSCQLKYRVDVLSGAFCAYLYVTKNGKSNCLYQWTGDALNHIPLNSRDFGQLVSSLVSVAGSIAAGIATGGASAAISAAAIGGAVGSLSGVNAGTVAADKASGNIGVIGNRTAYFIINRPVQNIVANYNKYVGYPCRQEFILSNMHGYTEIAEIHMEGFPATRDEITEIEQLLKGGVIF